MLVFGGAIYPAQVKIGVADSFSSVPDPQQPAATRTSCFFFSQAQLAGVDLALL